MMNETGLETKKECMDFAGYCVEDSILGCHPEKPQAFSCHPEGCFCPKDPVLTLEKQHQILRSRSGRLSGVILRAVFARRIWF